MDTDNDILIALIVERPVLWDKALETFKNRVATRNALREVCLMGFRSKFDELNRVRQRL
nr:unnamed protein product [Callosobruchus chinensis]